MGSTGGASGRGGVGGTRGFGGMGLVWATRIALYAQLLLGFDRLSPTSADLTRTMHLLFGVLVAALAFVAFRPVPGLRDPGPRRAARFFPLVPLTIGLYFRLAGGVLPALVAAHVILAFATVAFIEI